MEVEVEQGVHLRVDDEHDAAAATTVAAVGSTEWLELLAMYRGAPVAAAASPRVNDDAIDEPGHRTSFLLSVKLNESENSRQLHIRGKVLGLLALRSRTGGDIGSSSRDADDVDRLASTLFAELDGAGRRGEQCVVTATTDVDAGVEVGATLADDDLARLDDLAAEALDAEPLRVGVATVA